jgi:hypothetical protein
MRVIYLLLNGQYTSPPLFFSKPILAGMELETLDPGGSEFLWPESNFQHSGTKSLLSF